MRVATSKVEELKRFTARTEFVASRTALLDNGFAETGIQSWLASGRLNPLFQGVYSYGRDIETRAAAFRAALLVAGPGSVLTGLSACEIWGMVDPRGRIPGMIEVASSTGQTRRHSGKSPTLSQTTVLVVQRQYGPEETRVMNGLEVVRPALALADFAVNAPARPVRFAFLEGCRLKHFDQREVIDCNRHLRGRRGAKRVRPLLGLWVPELRRIKSVFEGDVLLDWVERDHPLPEVNVKVHGREVDFYFRKQRYALELDGGAFHSDPAQKRIDADKQRYLEARGETVRRLTYNEYEADRVGILRQIAADLGYA